MTGTKDWTDWHRSYADPDSALSQRLRVVRGFLQDWLDERPERPLTVVSACAGQADDLLGVLSQRADASGVRVTLIEYDQRNVDIAAAGAERAGLSVAALCADAGELASYAGAVPADLVLMAGVFGNISDADVRGTIAALPQLCAADATVIWTRTRRDPDLTPQIREWFAAAGFAERAFTAPEEVLFAVGVNQFAGVPQPLPAAGTLFRFLN
ncbi:hypothetical protein GCM10009765_20910 [Fodinicola feengrottensis]|uniref:SAM-dependent methyltransferase n=1 Tax=Fodinicola feengrottensis TaxID=435914 RepID=A0ABN2GHC0_9ACTN